MALKETVLGLDIGTNSVGWALIEGKQKIKAVGVRVFESGTDGTPDSIAAGKDEPRNQKRRDARLARRHLWRRARRTEKVYRLLSHAGMLPITPSDDPTERNAALNELDNRLHAAHVPPSDPRSAHLLPYILRKKALDERLDPQALGRALYHLAHRRGFLSNRKSLPKKDEDLGKVKSGIQSLREAMNAAGARTLGEYFTTLDPEAARIRTRWTAREMYVQEFERICAAQAPHHPDLLTETFLKQLRKAIFFQRPLKSQKHLIGKCMLEKNSPRAPWPLLSTQYFRLLQKVNDLRIVREEGEIGLSTEERTRLIKELQTEGDLTFPKIKTLLELKRTERFNLEQGDEKKIPGNRTAAKIREVLGARWDELSSVEKPGLVQDLMSIQNNDAFIRRATKRWDISESLARELANTGLEDGHCSLSSKAILRLTPLLEEGLSYAEARKKLYSASSIAAQASDELGRPPLLRNPIVERALNQVKKVVNSIVREYGKPTLVRVELARDLKRPRALRAKLSKANRALEGIRESAKEKILSEAGYRTPRRSDIEKAILWDECGGICPYTGASISFSALFGPESQFDVEHIIPYSRCLDDSFLNKTLCHGKANRNRKKNMSPFEAFSANEDEWNLILGRVRDFKGSAAEQKLRRFKMTSEEIQERFESFTNRHLQDTRYASVEAGRYLGALFGCREDQPGVDAEGVRRIQVSSGQITALLRSEWGLNGVLNDGGEKTRDDHRHHAVDAIVTALADPGVVKHLSDAAANAQQAGRRRFAPLKLPWERLVHDSRDAVAGITASHAPTRKVSGSLHEETLYSPPKRDGEGKDCVHVRKSLSPMLKPKPAEKLIGSIIDPAVRKAVGDHLARHGGDPKKAFSDESDMPFMTTGDGRKVAIRKVRVRVHQRTTMIGKGPRTRFVMTGANSHMEVFESKDAQGHVKWIGRVVSLLDAADRTRRRAPLVDQKWDAARFLFTITGGDCFAMTLDRGEQLFRVRTITTLRQKGREYPQVAFAPINDARTKDEMKKTKSWMVLMLEPMRNRECRKITIDPLGRTRRSRE